jgi:hypothetical protein
MKEGEKKAEFQNRIQASLSRELGSRNGICQDDHHYFPF